MVLDLVLVHRTYAKTEQRSACPIQNKSYLKQKSQILLPSNEQPRIFLLLTI